MPPIDLVQFKTFGAMLRFLRRRARLTQRDLAIAVGYSEAQISRLEHNQRLPDLTTLAALFVPELDLGDEPEVAARLLELAAEARGESIAGSSIRFSRTVVQEQSEELGALENVPALPVSYVERELLASLRRRLAEQRQFQLCGLPGIGKTVLLAAALATETQPVFWLTFAAEVTTTVEVLVHQLALFATAHGDQTVAPLLETTGMPKPALDQQLALLAQALGRLEPVLCFDNLHQAADSEALLQALRHLLTLAPLRAVLVGRELLPFSAMPTMVVAGLPAAEGVQLAQLLQPRLDARQAAELVERTGGNPMLLRLAAGLVAEQGPRLLERLAMRPQVANYLVDTALTDLPPAARTVLDILAVADQPLDLYDPLLVELACTELGPLDWDLALQTLTERLLIDDPAQASPPTLLREHVYTALVSQLERRRQLHRLIAEWQEQSNGDPLLTALHYARAAMPVAATELLERHWVKINIEARATLGVNVIDELLRLAQREAPAQVPILLGIRGDLLVNTPRAHEAEVNYREALKVAQPIPLRAHLTWRLASVLLQRGQPREAEQLTAGQLAELPESELVLRVNLQAVQGSALLMLSQFDAAFAAARAALNLTRLCIGELALLADQGRIQAAGTCAIVSHLRRDYDPAVEYFQIAIQSSRRLGFKRSLYRAMMNLGNLAFERGQYSNALEVFEEAIVGARQIGDDYALARVLHNSAIIKQSHARWTEALELTEEALTIKRRTGDVQGEANSLNLLAQLYLTLGQIEHAEQLVTQALALGSTTGDSHSRAIYQDTRAIIALIRRQPDVALALNEELLAQPAVQQDIRLHSFMENHRAFALLLTNDASTACALMAEPLLEEDPETAVERALIHSLALRAAADPTWTEVLQATLQQAVAADLRNYAATARRLLARPNAPQETWAHIFWVDSDAEEARLLELEPIRRHA